MNFNSKKYFGYHPLSINNDKARRFGSVSQQRMNRNDSYQSIRSEGARSFQNSRKHSLDILGKKLTGYHATDSRKYDHVAEILNRIEGKLARGNQNRTKKINERVQKLSRNNSHIELMNKSWHSQWEDKDKASLLTNASKVKQMEQTQKRRAVRNNYKI